ncbi:MAG: trypsin-like serine protease [Pseudomonadota bacterium]
MNKAVLLPLVSTLATLAAGGAGADPAELAAVGRLDLGGSAACTGTLVAPDLVLTAGHCLTKSRADGGDAPQIRFLPGRSPDHPPPELVPGTEIAVHPIFGFGIGPGEARIAFDLGLLRLDRPVSEEVARPIPLGALPELESPLFIAGYRGGRGSVARQRRCDVIEANHAVAALGCEVDRGESGSPMLQVRESRLEIVGVVSNKGVIEEQPVAYGPVTATGFDTILSYLTMLESGDVELPSLGLDAGN